MLTSYLRVEIYLTELKLAKYPDVEKTALRKFSKRDNLGEIDCSIAIALSLSSL